MMSPMADFRASVRGVAWASAAGVSAAAVAIGAVIALLSTGASGLAIPVAAALLLVGTAEAMFGKTKSRV